MDEQRNEYRTGRTDPRPRRAGFITLLLILVIFLCGLVSVLSIMNIHLFRLLDEKKESAALSFSKQEAEAPTQTENAVIFAGMTVQEIPAVYQTVHELPAGLYISHVQEGSAAANAGIIAGDVLTHFVGKPVTQLTDLRSALENRFAETATLTICRNGTEQTITIILPGE